MQDIDEYSQIYTAPGLRLFLHCQGERCRFELDGERGSEPLPAKVALIVLLQPRNDDGLPCGAVVRLATVAVPIWPIRDGRGFAGRGWLPEGITATMARRCHFRIEFCRMDADQSQPGPKRGSSGE